jgi:hypothetical protein
VDDGGFFLKFIPLVWGCPFADGWTKGGVCVCVCFGEKGRGAGEAGRKKRLTCCVNVTIGSHWLTLGWGMSLGQVQNFVISK